MAEDSPEEIKARLERHLLQSLGTRLAVVLLEGRAAPTSENPLHREITAAGKPGSYLLELGIAHGKKGFALHHTISAIGPVTGGGPDNTMGMIFLEGHARLNPSVEIETICHRIDERIEALLSEISRGLGTQ